MNKNININFKFLNFKCINLILISLIGVVFLDFKDLINSSWTVYDLILVVLNNYFAIFYVLYLLFSILILKTITRNGFKSYLYIRFKNRNQIFFSKIKFIMLSTFLFMLTIIVICILYSIGHFSLFNKWSEFSLSYFNGYNIFFEFSPIVASFLSALFIFFYLFTFGLILFVTSLFVKNNVFGFIIGFLINSINMICFLMKIRLFYKIGFCHNAILSFHKLNGNSPKPSIGYSIVYWFLVIIIILILGLKRINKIDIN